MKIHPQLRAAFHDPNDRWYWRVELTIYVLIAVSIALMAVEFWLGDTHPISLHVLVPVDIGLLVVFVVEVVLRVATYRPPELDFFVMGPTERFRRSVIGRIKFCFDPLVLFDILTVLALVPELRSLRALRLLRVLRASRVFKYSNPFGGVARAFSENRILFAFAFSIVGMAILIGGLSMFLIERGQNPTINGIADGIWWAIVTLTTVGYGDISPVTGLGRVLAGLMMVAGMFTLALFAGIVGHTMLNVVLTIREEQFLMGGYIDHILVCGYDPGASMLIDALREEFRDQDQRFVFFGPSERPGELPADFTWIVGDPTKESELPKAHVDGASCVILIGSRSSLPQIADATTILTAFTLRRYLGRSKGAQRRKKPLYVIGEILDHENIEHARKAGCDEVIETTRVGFSMVTHAVRVPGAADILSALASTRSQSLFIGDPKHSGTFGEVAQAVKTRTGALVIGYRDLKSGQDILNPKRNIVLPEGTHVVYLAVDPVLGA